MCVTNTTHRRVQAVSLTPSQVGVCPSALSQRLLGALVPNAAFAVPRSEPTDEYVSNAPEKPRIIKKRRRKPQKPGKTAKNNERHFVVHDYHDHASEQDEEANNGKKKGGVSVAFPLKLHMVLDQVETDGLMHIVSWQPHGRCFVIHKPNEFVDIVMPRYFRQTKLTSFQRQLNLYGFNRLTKGADAGGYYHELFLRGKDFLCKKMVRTKVKGTRFKAASSPDQEPDFYSMPPVVVTPHNSSDEEMSHDSSAHDSHDSSAHDSIGPEPEEPTSSSAIVPEPVPIQFANISQAPAPVAYSPVIAVKVPSYNVLSAPGPEPVTTAPVPDVSDRILDEAVNELFLNEDGDQDSLEDFVKEWGCNSTNNFGDVLQDDIQLGFMLDKLLED